MSQKVVSTSVEQTAKFASEYVAGLRAGKRGFFARVFGGRPRATVVALSGDLGSGKTTFVKALASSLGVPQDEVTSPTFVIMKGYDVAGPFKRLIHIDAYRLESPDQAAHIGWDALVADPANLILVEWPEKLGKRVPRTAQKISFLFIDDVTREISLQ